MGNLIINFRKKNGVWYIDKIYKKQRIQLQGKNKAELELKVRERMRQIDVILEEGIILTSKKCDFDTLFMEYSKECGWSAYTHKKQYQRYIKYFDEFRNSNIANIKDSDIKNWYVWILEQPFQKHYANKLFRIMKGCIRIAYVSGFLNRKIDLSYIDSKSVRKESKKNPLSDGNYITKKDLNLICDKVDLIPNNRGSRINKNDFKFIIKFLFYTGCRINEARAIKIKNIYWNEEENNNGEILEICKIKLDKQLEDNSILEKPLKCGKHREIYILKEFHEDLKCYVNNKGLTYNDYLFDISKEGFPLSRKKIHDSINNNLKALKEFGLVDNNFISQLSPHGFRYSNRLYFEQCGIGDDISARNRGHSQLVMKDIYSRIDKDFINSFYTYGDDNED